MFEELGMRIRVTIFLAEDIAITTSEHAEQVTEQVKQLLICLKKEPRSVKEALKQLGLNHRPTFMYAYLKPARDVGLVEMTQPNSPRSPRQKYQLTKKGEEFLFMLQKNEG